MQDRTAASFSPSASCQSDSQARTAAHRFMAVLVDRDRRRMACLSLSAFGVSWGSAERWMARARTSSPKADELSMVGQGLEQ